MNPRSCQHLQRSLSRIHQGCSRHYSTHQLSISTQARSLITSRASSAFKSPAHSTRGIAFRRASSMTSEPQFAEFAEGIDSEQLRHSLSELQGQGWSLDEDKIGIKKPFYFRAYFKAVSFVNVIASQSAVKKHHATMTIRFGSVDVHWTTHHPRGLTDKDISMAQYCEQAAELLGAVQEGQSQKCGPGA